MDPDEFDPDGRFRDAIDAARHADPLPTFRTLAANLGVPVEDVVHYALYRWAAAGAEALMAGPPQVLEELRDAAAAGDVDRVRGIAAFLIAGFDAPES